MRAAVIAAVLFSSLGLAQTNFNTFQPLPTASRNTVARVGAGYLYGGPQVSGNGGNASFQLIFTAGSGNLTDTACSGVTMTASGSPTYSLQSTAYSPTMSPSIRLSPAGSEAAFANAGAQSCLDLGTGGTGSAVIEWVARFDDGVDACVGGATTGYFFNTEASSGGNGYGLSVTCNSASSNYALDIFASDATNGSVSWTNPHSGAAPWVGGNGVSHKWRLIIDRGANTAELIYDHTSFGTKSIAAISGKAVQAQQIKLGGRWDTFRPFDITYTEFRVSKDTTTANSGGPNGG